MRLNSILFLRYTSRHHCQKHSFHPFPNRLQRVSLQNTRTFVSLVHRSQPFVFEKLFIINLAPQNPSEIPAQPCPTFAFGGRNPDFLLPPCSSIHASSLHHRPFTELAQDEFRELSGKKDIYRFSATGII